VRPISLDISIQTTTRVAFARNCKLISGQQLAASDDSILLWTCCQKCVAPSKIEWPQCHGGSSTGSLKIGGMCSLRQDPACLPSCLLGLACNKRRMLIASEGMLRNVRLIPSLVCDLDWVVKARHVDLPEQHHAHCCNNILFLFPFRYFSVLGIRKAIHLPACDARKTRGQLQPQ
jgi:hypothetical protein